MNWNARIKENPGFFLLPFLPKLQKYWKVSPALLFLLSKLFVSSCEPSGISGHWSGSKQLRDDYSVWFIPSNSQYGNVLFIIWLGTQVAMRVLFKLCPAIKSGNEYSKMCINKTKYCQTCPTASVLNSVCVYSHQPSSWYGGIMVKTSS